MTNTKEPIICTNCRHQEYDNCCHPNSASDICILDGSYYYNTCYTMRNRFWNGCRKSGRYFEPKETKETD